MYKNKLRREENRKKQLLVKREKEEGCHLVNDMLLARLELSVCSSEGCEAE